jgi:hypothetical protein
MNRDLVFWVALGFLTASASAVPSRVAFADEKKTVTEKTYGDHDHDLDDEDTVTKKKVVTKKHHGDDKKVIKKKIIKEGEPDETVVEKKTIESDDD